MNTEKNVGFWAVAAVALVLFGFLVSSMASNGKFGAGTTYSKFAKLIVGSSGTALSSIYSATSSIDFATIPNGQCSASTMTVTGAQVADTTNPPSVAIAIPTAMQSGYATSVSWTGWVSAADTVSIRGCAGTSTAMAEPPAMVFGATVIQP